MKPRIILIDDEPNIREELSFILRQEGYEVTDYENAKVFLDEVHEKEFPETDLMIVDIMMPGLSGVGLIQELSLRGLLESIPVLFLTALGEDSDIIEAHESAAMAFTVDYLRKPYQTGWLLSRVKNLVNLKYYHQELMQTNREIANTNMQLNQILNESTTKNDYYKKLTSLLNREKTDVQKKLSTIKELFYEIAVNDLPLIRFVINIIEKSREFLEQTATGFGEEEDMFRLLPKTLEPLRTSLADFDQSLSLLINLGILRKDTFQNISIEKTAFYHMLQNLYDQGGISPGLFNTFLQSAKREMEQDGGIEIF
jgi:DNA-binding response OmpR family regulator